MNCKKRVKKMNVSFRINNTRARYIEKEYVYIYIINAIDKMITRKMITQNNKRIINSGPRSKTQLMRRFGKRYKLIDNQPNFVIFTSLKCVK